jgi:hypothetical protein
MSSAKIGAAAVKKSIPTLCYNCVAGPDLMRVIVENGITTKTMIYSAGNNSGVPLMHEVGQNLRGHGGIIINAESAAKLGIHQDDWIEVRSIVAATRGRAVPVQGCHPDTIVIPGQHEHWKTPFAKDLNFPSALSPPPDVLSARLVAGSI